MQTEFHSGLPGHRVFSPVHISISIGTAPRTLASIGPDKKFHTSRRVRAASTWKLEKHSAPGPLKLPRTRRCFFLTWTKNTFRARSCTPFSPCFSSAAFVWPGVQKKMVLWLIACVQVYICICVRVHAAEVFWAAIYSEFHQAGTTLRKNTRLCFFDCQQYLYTNKKKKEVTIAPKIESCSRRQNFK